MTSVATPVQRKLPVWRTVGACYATVARNLGQLVRISWLWLLIMLPVYAAVAWLVWTWTAESGGFVGEVMVALPLVVELPLLASIAVAWHRLVLRQETVTGFTYLRLDSFVWEYLLYSFAFLLLAQVPAMCLFYIRSQGLYLGDTIISLLWLLVALAAGVVAVALAALILPRISLVLPAVALGERLSATQAWQMTRDNTWRLALASLLCLLPAIVARELYDWFADTQTRPAYVVSEMLYLGSTAVLVIFAVTLLSLSYRFFASPRDEDSA